MDFLTTVLLILAGIIGSVYCIELFQFRPRLALLVFLFFVLIQGLLVNQVGGIAHPVGKALTYIDETVILLIFGIILLDTFVSRRRVYLTPLCAGLAIIAITGTVGGLIGRTPALIVISDILIFFKGFMVFYIFSCFYYAEEKLKAGIKYFGMIGIVIVFLGLLELYKPIEFRALTGNELLEDYWRMGIPSVQSIFVHAGIFGWFCGFCALFSFALYLHEKKRSYIFLFLVFTLGVLISMRVKAIVALVAAVSFGLWLYSARYKVRLVGLIGIIAVIIMLFFGTQIYGVFRQQFQEYQNPLKPRNVLYRTGVIIAEKHFPFGVGFGRFGGEIAARYYSPVYDRYKFSQIHGLWPKGRFLRDTFWPMILGELGFVGFIAYGGVMIFLFRLLLKSYRRADTPFLKAFTLGVLMVYIEAMMESLAEPVFIKPPACYVLFAVMGISYSLYLNRGMVKTAERV